MQNRQDSPKEPNKGDNPFRQTRNYQVSQQAILLALLNNYFSITITSPKKRSVVAQQILIITSLNNETDRIECEQFIQKRLTEIIERDIGLGVSSKTAMRRNENNRIVEGIHLFMDILRELGYVFTTTTTEGKNGTNKTETVHCISHGDHFLFSKPQILSIGLGINKYIVDSLANNHTLILSKNDSTLAGYIRGEGTK